MKRAAMNPATSKAQAAGSAMQSTLAAPGPVSVAGIFPWRSLKIRAILYTLAIFMLGILSLVFHDSRMLRDDMQRALSDQQFSMVSLLAGEINRDLDDQLRTLAAVAGVVSPAMLSNAAALQTFLEQRPRLQSLFNGGAIVFGFDGTAIAEIPLSAGRIGVNYMERDHIVGALREGKATIGRPFMDKTLRAPIVAMAVPIRDAQGKVIGALAGVTDLNKPNYFDVLIESGYGKTGGYFLASPQYRLNITATDKRRIMQSLPAPGVIPAIDRFVQGYEGSDLYVNQLGEEVLVSAKGIPVAGWKLVAALPTAEAFAPIRAMQQRMLLAAIFLSLLASGLIWWMLKRLLQPIIATLQESDARHKAVIDSALDAIVVNDAEGRITEFNPAAERTFGHRRDEVLGKELAELLIPGGDGGTRRREFVEELAQGVPAFHGRRIEVPALHADGHEFPIELAVQQIKWDGQEFFIAFARDLTESKRTAALLREREEVFRALFETSQDAIMTLAPPSWAFTSGNPAALRMFGVRGEMEFASLGPGELSPETQPDGRPSSEKAREMIATAMREGAHAFEWTHQRLGGESFPAAVVLTRVALAERVFLQACVRDVSAERRAREELRASEDHLRKTAEILRQSQQLLEGIVEHIPVMVFVKDASDLHFELLNRAGEELLGYSRSDLLGKGNYDFWPKEQGDWFTTEDRKVLAKKEVTEIPEEPIQTASGETRYLHTWKVALRDENDEPRHLLGISVDITERKRTEAALAEALRAKSEFMANVTHELRTPLNSVIGFAELLKDEVPGPLNAKQAAFTADILAAGQHLHRLVQGILELSRLDVTGAGIERETVEIGAALEERVAAQRKAAEVQRVSISLEVAADVGSATLDPKALRRMLDALLDNAIKFNRDGGRVAVSARRAGGALEIAVADTGIGIAQEDLAKLFKPLTQLDAGLARRHGGVGLGLALARRLAELHGGTIEVESEHGKGSTFTLRLPIEGHS